MITQGRLFAMFAGLQHGELERWIAEEWVRPERQGDDLVFHDIDVARVRLLVELRDELRLDEDALPVVLSLMDQLYATRRRMRLLCEAIDQAGEELHDAVASELRRRMETLEH
jgi:chaperone modulatory protein CbpM